MTGFEIIAGISAAAGMATSLIGASQQASAIRQAGREQKRLAEYQAEQARVAAGQERASGQRAAIEQDRKTRLAQSRAIAIGAAQGGTLDDSLLNIISDIGKEGKYSHDFQLFQSEDAAKNLEQRGALLDYQGQNALVAAKREASGRMFSAIGDTVGRAATLYSKYGGGAGNSEDMIKWNDGTSGYYSPSGRRFT